MSNEKHNHEWGIVLHRTHVERKTLKLHDLTFVNWNLLKTRSGSPSRVTALFECLATRLFCLLYLDFIEYMYILFECYWKVCPFSFSYVQSIVNPFMTLEIAILGYQKLVGMVSICTLYIFCAAVWLWWQS